MTKNDKEEITEPTENGDTGSKWIPLQRDYAHEIEQITVARVPATVHPLLGKEILTKLGTNYRGAADVYRDIAEGHEPTLPTPVSPIASTPVSPSNTSYDDPLRSPTTSVKKPEVFDPLRALAAEEKKMASTPLTSIPNVDTLPFSTSSTPAPEFEIWRDKRSRILTTYSTNKRIPVSANFLEEEEKEKKVVAVDNAKSRLEQLEMEQETEAAKNYMTQKEYITHIEEQLDKLRNAWENNERVVSLKIAIQCAKLLGDTSVPQFYPSMYVLLTEILDVFGDLVFNRIKKKGIDVIDPLTKQKVATSLPANFKASDVSLSAKETCRNWFYKTACIRELMPRLYIDLALIKSYRFLDDPDTFPALLARLSRTIRGIGDPLAAAYARAYLATKAGDLANSFTNDAAKAGEARSVPKEYQNVLLEAFDDFMFSFKDLNASNFASIVDIKNDKISVDDYIDLYSPALEWILQNIGYKSTEDIFFALLQQHKDYCNNSMILVHILASFDASFVSNHALDMTTLIKEATEIKAVPKSKLYLTLGRALVRRAPPLAQRLPILNDVWKVVTKIKEPLEYIEIAEIFVQYLLMNFTDREVNIFLKDVLKHIKKDAAYKLMQTQLANIVGNIMTLNKDLNKTLAMDNFLPILDLLEKSSKVTASKSVLVQFSKTGFRTSDPVIIHTLFDVARSLHDSVDSLSFEDERKQISALIVNCIRQIDFGRDLEQQLNFYVECRQAFTNLDPVIAELVVRVALLAMSAHKFMKGNHSKKTSAFVKACLAYCHITIPSLDDIFSRLRLFLICGEVALVNQMIAQGEGFLKAAISLLPDVPPTIELYKRITSTEDDLVQYLRNFSSFLLLFPGHPEHGPFYLVKGLLNAIQSYPPWNNTVSVGKTRVYLGVLSLFFAYYQRNFPVHIQGVESNDSLYGGDTAYIKQLQQFVDTLINEILAEITKIGDKGDLMSKKQQGTVALEFVNLLISGLTMNPQSATLVVKLYQLAVKTNAVDTAFLSSTLRHIQNKKGTWYSDIASKIQAATASSSS